MHTLVFLFLHLASFAASFVFCWKYISIDFIDAIFAFMVGVSELGLIYSTITSILMRYHIEGIFSSLSIIYKGSK